MRRLSLLLGLIFLFSLPARSLSVEFFAITYKSGLPLENQDIRSAVEDLDWLQRAIDHNFQLIRHMPKLKYQVVGLTDGSECDHDCSELAARRARLFQESLVSSGVPRSLFCPFKVEGPPWPSPYTPEPDESLLGRQAVVVPMFDGCA